MSWQSCTPIRYQTSEGSQDFTRPWIDPSNLEKDDCREEYFFEDTPEIGYNDASYPAFARDENGHFNNEWNEFRDMVPSFSMYKNVRVRIVAADCV